MFQIIQSELYRIRKNRLFFLCLLLSTFFMFAYALTYHYDTVKTAGLTGGIASLNGFTEFLFSDYSLVIPMTIFQLIYVTEDYQKGIHEILFMKGVSRFDFFFGKLLALWIATLFYLIFSFFMAYLFILSTWIKQPYIEFSLTGICGYLILQILCFIGYSSFLWLLSCLIPYRNIVLVVSFFLLGTLYLYLTKISTALDLEYSLYKYWIVGLSDQMEINLSMIQLSATLITIAAYILFPTGAAYWIYQKADLRKHERRCVYVDFLSDFDDMLFGITY